VLQLRLCIFKIHSLHVKFDRLWWYISLPTERMSQRSVGNSMQVSDSNSKVEILEKIFAKSQKVTSLPIHSCHRVALLDPIAIHTHPPCTQSSCVKIKIKIKIMRHFRLRQWSGTNGEQDSGTRQGSTSQSVGLLLCAHSKDITCGPKKSTKKIILTGKYLNKLLWSLEVKQRNNKWWHLAELKKWDDLNSGSYRQYRLKPASWAK
jgi:hypothetical protein